MRMLQKNLLPARQEQTVEILANSEKDRWSKNSKMPHLQQKSDMWLDRSRHSLDTNLIKVEDKKKAEDAKLDDVKEQIKSEIMQKKQQEAYTAKVEELKKKYMA